MVTKDKSAIISGMGVGMSIIQTLVGKARRRGVSDEVIHSLATPEGDTLLDQFVEIMAGTQRGTNDSNLHSVTVNYGLSLAEMIAAGHYDWVNNDITAKRFPVKGEGVVNVEIQLVHLNCTMESDDILRELDTMGLRPATIEELLAFGAKYPDIQCEFPIVALGSVCRRVLGHRRVPCLGWNGAGRRLGLYWFGLRWSGGCRFAAVRK
ncbi:MAG: hypothetical protein HYS44_00845 [Candidatus Niyogibacteria bacterium]|nr:hypothetical protein [Candidatus Niyogibacteria bacterium]